MSDFFPPPSEDIQPVEVQEVEAERQALDDATNEPQAYVEQTSDYQQAEAIQTNFETVVDNAARASAPVETAAPVQAEQIAPEPAPEQQVVRADVELPQPAETQEEFIEAAPKPVYEKDQDDEEEPPLQAMEAGETDIQPEVASQVETLPGPLPQPADEVSNLPGPMPQPADEVSTLPTPLPQPADEVSDLPGPMPQPASEVSTPQTGVGDVGSLPVPFPNEAEVQQTGVDDVGSLPVPFPKPTDEVSPQVDQAQRGSLPVPFPRPAGETHSQVSSKMEMPQAGAMPDAQTEAAFEPTPDQQVLHADVELPQVGDTKEAQIDSAPEPIEAVPIQLPGVSDAASVLDNDLRTVQTEAQVEDPSSKTETYSKKIKMPKAREAPAGHIESEPQPLPDQQSLRADVELPQSWETQEEQIQAPAQPVRDGYPDDEEEPPLQAMEARDGIQVEDLQRLEAREIQRPGVQLEADLQGKEARSQVSSEMEMPGPGDTQVAHTEVAFEQTLDQQVLRADVELPQVGDTQEEHIQAPSETAASEPVESIPIQLPGESRPASKADIGSAQVGEGAGDAQAGLPEREALPKEKPEQADRIAGIGAQGAFAAERGSKEIPGEMMGDMAGDSALLDGYSEGEGENNFQSAMEGIWAFLTGEGSPESTEGFAPSGFDVIENYLKGIPESGGTKGSSGNSGGHSSTSGSSQTGTQTGWEDQGGSMSKPQEDTGKESSGQTYGEIMNSFMAYCKDAYDSGDRPDDGDVSGWVAKQAANFFEERGGDSTLVGILREMAENKEGKNNEKITVTRIIEGGEESGSGSAGIGEGSTGSEGSASGGEAGAQVGGLAGKDVGGDEQGSGYEGSQSGASAGGDAGAQAGGVSGEGGANGGSGNGSGGDSGASGGNGSGGDSGESGGSGDDGENGDNGSDDGGGDGDDDGDDDSGDDGGGNGNGGNGSGTAMSEEGDDDSGHHTPILGGVPFTGDEKDDTGQRPGIFGGPGDSGDGDDTGGKEGLYFGSVGELYPDSGGALPIDPIAASALDSGMRISDSEGSIQNQLKGMEVPGKDSTFSINFGAGGLVSWKRTSTK